MLNITKTIDNSFQNKLKFPQKFDFIKSNMNRQRLVINSCDGACKFYLFTPSSRMNEQV